MIDHIGFSVSDYRALEGVLREGAGAARLWHRHGGHAGQSGGAYDGAGFGDEGKP